MDNTAGHRPSAGTACDPLPCLALLERAAADAEGQADALRGHGPESGLRADAAELRRLRQAATPVRVDALRDAMEVLGLEARGHEAEAERHEASASVPGSHPTRARLALGCRQAAADRRAVAALLAAFLPESSGRHHTDGERPATLAGSAPIEGAPR